MSSGGWTVSPLSLVIRWEGWWSNYCFRETWRLAGVAIDPAPPQGVFTWPGHSSESNFPAINPFVPVTQPVQMTF